MVANINLPTTKPDLGSPCQTNTIAEIEIPDINAIIRSTFISLQIWGKKVC